ncbi:MAG TPA: CheR family methyltransferase [Bacteroidota bacterium]|nr:CheR family methyltransferase [Bacteroidota bacterium]
MAFTFFFRDTHVLDLIAEHVIPDLSGFSRVRVWDAGCAMGPEPYTLAIYFAEHMGKFAYRNLRIDASDIDESGNFREIIEAGVYASEGLQRIPQNLLAKYFTKLDGTDAYIVVEEVRQRLVYHKHDLLTLQPIGSGYHLILCKNVLLHFQPAERVAVMKMFHQSLTVGGFFATEQTQKLPEELEPYFEQITISGQLFRKRECPV